MFTASVVICTYNRASMLGGALRSVLSQQVPRGTSFEVVVVDDGSTDETADIVRDIAAQSQIPVRYRLGDHAGVSTARNIGAAAAQGEWVAFLDDDEVARPDWLAILLETAYARGADCVGGPYELMLLEPPPFELPATVRKLLGSGPPPKPGALWWPGCGNALIRRSLFDRVGYFDPLISCGEDADFFNRARRCGASIVYADGARIAHVVPPYRLERSQLFAAAKRGAASRAFEEFKQGGAGAVLWNSVLRLGWTAVVLGPRLTLEWLTRRDGQALGSACSARYSFDYSHEAARLLWLAMWQRIGMTWNHQ